MADATKETEIGYEIPNLIKIAAMQEWNPERSVIHEESYAKQMGMRGALLGGSILYSYLVEMLYRYFGDSWLSHGEASVSFIGGGVIPGDKVTMKGIITDKKSEDSSTRLFVDIWMENETSGSKVVVGKASCLVA